jgi:hypothetical protein
VKSNGFPNFALARLIKHALRLHVIDSCIGTADFKTLVVIVSGACTHVVEHAGHKYNRWIDPRITRLG